MARKRFKGGGLSRETLAFFAQIQRESKRKPVVGLNHPRQLEGKNRNRRRKTVHKPSTHTLRVIRPKGPRHVPGTPEYAVDPGRSTQPIPLPSPTPDPPAIANISLDPRGPVIVEFFDSRKRLRKYRALFDPKSEVSLASRQMVDELGLRSVPWKPVQYPPRQTPLGLLEPKDFVFISTQSLEYGVPKPFRLHVAVLDQLFANVDFYFGHPAIQAMALRFKGFRRVLREGLCGDSACLIAIPEDDDDDDDDENADSLVVNMEHVSTRDLPNQTDMAFPNPPQTMPSHTSPDLITPAQSSTNSVFEYWPMDLASNQFDPSASFYDMSMRSGGPSSLPWAGFPGPPILVNAGLPPGPFGGAYSRTVPPVDNFSALMDASIPPSSSVSSQEVNSYSQFSGTTVALSVSQPGELFDAVSENGEFNTHQA